jgi:hypothetical protein
MRPWKKRHVAGDLAYELGTISVSLELPNGKQVQQSVGAIRILARQPGCLDRDRYYGDRHCALRNETMNLEPF